MNAEIISVGTELLLGEIVNTDAQFISEKLSQIGVSVYRQTVVGDNAERLENAVMSALKRSDIVITSGGLGPTQDDITKEILCKCMGERLVLHRESLVAMRAYFEHIKRPMVRLNEKQAYMPENGIVLPNNNGTAPGAVIEKKGKTVIMLPGPPNELKPMFEESVIPYLKSKSEYVFVSRVLQIFGIGESAVAEKLDNMLKNYTNPTVAPYAKTAGVRLRITAKCKSEDEGQALIEPVEAEIRALLGDAVFGEGDAEINEVVSDMLRKRKMTISAAESCTGGMFAKLITDLPGSSDILNESIVTYSNDAKMKYLGVKKETLDAHGAVSRETAYEMAEGICRQSGADVGVGITGIAGPGGGTAQKPVGLVYAGICIGGKTEVLELHLNGTRDKIRYSVCVNVFDAIRRKILHSS
jgi:nicotinamide-nucleotide amidase